jgi:4-amino-4-deoxy-L-arabinose transferase-like glycosyltransferase
MRRVKMVLAAARIGLAAALFLRLAGSGRAWLPSPISLAALLVLLLLVEAAWARRASRARRHGHDWRDLLRTWGFTAGLCTVTLLALAVRLPSIGGDLRHTPIDIDEFRLASNVQHFFLSGELVHTTVEHYPGIVFWILAGSSLIAYVWELMRGAISSIGDMPVDTFVLVVRVANTFIAAATVLITALIGRRVSSAAAGLLAAVVLAVMPLAIDVTTVARNDPGLVLAAVAAAFAALVAFESDRRTPAVVAGVAAGLAAAIKYTGVFAFVPVLVATSLRGSVQLRVRRIALASMACLLAVLVSNHFIWADFPNFISQLSIQVAVTGRGHYAASDNPAAAHFEILRDFGPGWPMLLAAAGFGVYGLAAGRAQAWIFWTFPLLYSWFTTQRPSQFPRWVYPVAPFLAVAGAGGLASVASALRGSRSHLEGRRRSLLRNSISVGAIALVAGPPLWSGLIRFSQRLTPQTHELVERWLEQHAAGRSVLLEDGWLDLTDSSVHVNRVADLRQPLKGGLYALCTNGWVVVPETRMGSSGLDRLQFVARVQSDYWAFGGHRGYDYDIYAVPKLPQSSSVLDIRLDELEAAPFLGPEWPASEPGVAGLVLPVDGASLYLPPMPQGEGRFALDFVDPATEPDRSSVSLTISGEPVALREMPSGDNSVSRRAGSVGVPTSQIPAELRLSGGTGRLRILRVRFELVPSLAR